METKTLITRFLEENMGDVSHFFMYKDHQLLKENKFDEFIEGQLSKSRLRYYLGIFLYFIALVLGLAYFWLYLDSESMVQLINAIFWLGMSGLSLHWFSKQYFLVSSTMKLVRTLLDENEK